MDKRYLTSEGAMQYLSISRTTLYGLVKERQIPFGRIGRTIRFDLKKLDEWMAKKNIERRVVYNVVDKVPINP